MVNKEIEAWITIKIEDKNIKDPIEEQNKVNVQIREHAQEEDCFSLIKFWNYQWKFLDTKI